MLSPGTLNDSTTQYLKWRATVLKLRATVRRHLRCLRCYSRYTTVLPFELLGDKIQDQTFIFRRNQYWFFKQNIKFFFLNVNEYLCKRKAENIEQIKLSGFYWNFVFFLRINWIRFKKINWINLKKKLQTTFIWLKMCWNSAWARKARLLMMCNFPVDNWFSTFANRITISSLDEWLATIALCVFSRIWRLFFLEKK